MPHHTPISEVCLITVWISNYLRRVFPEFYQRAGSQADFGSLQALALQLARVYAQRPSCFVSFSIMFFSGKHKSEFVILKIEVILHNSNNNLEVAHPQSRCSSTWFLVELEFENVGFWGEGKSGVPGEKPLGARERTNNKLNSHMASTPWFEPGPHLVGGEHSHFCAIPFYESFSFSFPSLKRWPPRLHLLTLSPLGISPKIAFWSSL